MKNPKEDDLLSVKLEYYANCICVTAEICGAGETLKHRFLTQTKADALRVLTNLWNKGDPYVGMTPGEILLLNDPKKTNDQC